MKRIIEYIRSQKKQTRLFFAVGLGVTFVCTYLVMKDYGYIWDQYGSLMYLGRVAGAFLGVFVPVLTISLVISVPTYYIFRDFAEKYREYLDYLAVVFVIISIVVSVVSVLSYNRRQSYQEYMRTHQESKSQNESLDGPSVGRTSALDKLIEDSQVKIPSSTPALDKLIQDNLRPGGVE